MCVYVFLLAINIDKMQSSSFELNFFQITNLVLVLSLSIEVCVCVGCMYVGCIAVAKL